MTILIFGKNGQIGRALQSMMFEKPDIIFLGREDCDLGDSDALEKVLNQYQPQVIINASAYTAVDQAETESPVAFAINLKAPEVMAQYIAHQNKGLLIHYSTDYVFADSQKVPYSEDDDAGPLEKLGVYGQSKWAGENAILEAFHQANVSSTYYIIRTSWVYGDSGNFIRTILRFAKERESLSVVADQVGAPTSAIFLASLARQFLYIHTQYPGQSQSGIYHAVPHGHTSWFGLASYVMELAQAMDPEIKIKLQNLQSITASDYPVAAPRPYNSRLSNAKLANYLGKIKGFMEPTVQLQAWQIEVERYVRQLIINK